MRAGVRLIKAESRDVQQKLDWAVYVVILAWTSAKLFTNQGHNQIFILENWGCFFRSPFFCILFPAFPSSLSFSAPFDFSLLRGGPLKCSCVCMGSAVSSLRGSGQGPGYKCTFGVFRAPRTRLLATNVLFLLNKIWKPKQMCFFLVSSRVLTPIYPIMSMITTTV